MLSEFVSCNRFFHTLHNPNDWFVRRSSSLSRAREYMEPPSNSAPNLLTDGPTFESQELMASVRVRDAQRKSRPRCMNLSWAARKEHMTKKQEKNDRIVAAVEEWDRKTMEMAKKMAVEIGITEERAWRELVRSSSRSDAKPKAGQDWNAYLHTLSATVNKGTYALC